MALDSWQHYGNGISADIARIQQAEALVVQQLPHHSEDRIALRFQLLFHRTNRPCHNLRDSEPLLVIHIYCYARGRQAVPYAITIIDVSSPRIHPANSPQPLAESSAAALEWPRLREAIASKTFSPLGRTWILAPRAFGG